MSEFLDTTPVGPQFQRLVQIVYEALPGDQDFPTLEESLTGLAGTRLTEAALTAAAWRLAGNYQRLAQRRVVAPWGGQHLLEWVPVQVQAARIRRSPGGAKLGFTFTLKILAGTPAGRTVQKWWSTSQCRFYARNFKFSRSFGPNSRAEEKYPYRHPTQFVSLRFYALMDPDLSGAEPDFFRAGWPAAVAEWNREMVKKRFRVDPGYTCPQRFPATVACHQCPFGYTTCPAGTHRETWTVRPCAKCGNDRAVFDPELPDAVCLDCHVKLVYQRKI